ncbi:MAG: alkylmercury lyase family protein [Bacteroidota bacterium]
MITNATLHYTLIKEIIDRGYAPDVEALGTLLQATEKEVIQGLYDLQEYHGVVLHPHEPKVWVIHPFSLAPTNFYVESARGAWWGNCAWCSLGVAALLQEDVKITTTLGAQTQQIEIHIRNGEIQEKNYFIHFPIPMKNAWENVIYTCSNMLVFENEEQVNAWSERHQIPRGDLQPIERIWQFSQKWYGNHLNPAWKKWTIQEAKELFQEFALTDKIWDLDSSGERF